MNARSLTIAQPNGKSEVFHLVKATVTIGRGEANQLPLLGGDNSVSRRHAQIQNGCDSPAILTDLDSGNGTFVNGSRIDGPVRLRTNDKITIGGFSLTYWESQAADPPFAVEMAPVDLRELQEQPQVLDFGRAYAPELKHLELLHEIGMTLAMSGSLEDVTAVAVKLLFKIEPVHRAAIMLWNEEKQCFQSVDLHARGRGQVSSDSGPYNPNKLVMSRTILTRVRQENRALLIRDTTLEDSLKLAKSVVTAGIQAAFCSPLTFQGRFLGVLYADNLAHSNAFSDADFRTFTTIAAQTGLALANAIARNELRRREAEREALKLYLAPQVADLILSSGGLVSLTGSLQPVTVLYADIRGFTRMSEKMDAREVVQMLNDFFTIVSEVIFRHNGTVDKFIGDCIMALFGAPIASESALSDAFAAAIEIQREVRRWNDGPTSGKRREIHIGIGLHTGPAVVGNIGSSRRVQYTAIGDTVNIASRLVDLAAPDQIVVSRDVCLGLGNRDGFEPIGEVALKGRESHLEIYSAQWA